MCFIFFDFVSFTREKAFDFKSSSPPPPNRTEPNRAEPKHTHTHSHLLLGPGPSVKSVLVFILRRCVSGWAVWRSCLIGKEFKTSVWLSFVLVIKGRSACGFCCFDPEGELYWCLVRWMGRASVFFLLLDLMTGEKLSPLLFDWKKKCLRYYRFWSPEEVFLCCLTGRESIFVDVRFGWEKCIVMWCDVTRKRSVLLCHVWFDREKFYNCCLIKLSNCNVMFYLVKLIFLLSEKRWNSYCIEHLYIQCNDYCVRKGVTIPTLATCLLIMKPFTMITYVVGCARVHKPYIIIPMFAYKHGVIVWFIKNTPP